MEKQLDQAGLWEKISPEIKAHGRLHRKFRNVLVRPARPGEVVVTSTADGKETENRAEPGDFVLRNLTAAAEEYVIKPKALAERYRLLEKRPDGLDLYEPTGRALALELTAALLKRTGLPSSFHFTAPWGQPMAAKKGDFLAVDEAERSAYRIARREFFETYEAVPTRDELIAKAQAFLHGGTLVEGEVVKLAKSLEEMNLISYARRVRKKLYDSQHSDSKNVQRDETGGRKVNMKNVRTLAVMTYKDDDLPIDLRHDYAERLIQFHYGREPKDIDHCDAAGILGAIHKRRWRADNQDRHLHDALAFYLRGNALWAEAAGTYLAAKQVDAGAAKKASEQDNFADKGYCALNAAFILDQLARQMALGEHSREQTGPLRDCADRLRSQADQLRRAVADFCTWFANDTAQVMKIDYWFYATWAEALLGRAETEADIEAAVGKLDEGIQLAREPWMLDSTLEQLPDMLDTLLADKDKLRKLAIEKVEGIKWEIRQNGGSEASTGSSNGGQRGANLHFSNNEKVGLALSGGGFRAALYHIGVLARLAEADLLKRVEVISCVSGGSIIGAYYYLELKRAMEAVEAQRLTEPNCPGVDYVKLVKRIERDFLAKISSNLRLRVLGHFGHNWRIALSRTFTRTLRLADLYEKVLFHDLHSVREERKKWRIYRDLLFKKDGKPERRLLMSDLMFKKNDKPISLRAENRRREEKYPLLVLNATSLNTGHNWQFTAKSMGEPPAYIDNELDARETYRRMYYDEAPEQHRDVRLAVAVAASSCVPGLFAPVEFEGLYEGGRTLRLVDGGVQDNQGVNTLLEQGCNVLLISDASGQMPVDNDPSALGPRVLGRMSSIVQERVREAQIQDLRARRASNLLKRCLLVHLTKGLPSNAVNWADCNDPYEPLSGPPDEVVLTPQEVPKRVQHALANVRTDLDSFHEMEAFALMRSGYLMTKWELEHGDDAAGFGGKDAAAESPDPPDDDWQFNRIRPMFESEGASKDLEKVLKASSNLFGKVARLSTDLKVDLSVIGLTAVLFLFRRLDRLWEANCWKPCAGWWVVGAALLFGADYLVGKGRFRVPGLVFRLVSLPFLVGPIWGLAAFLRRMFNAYYLWLGRAPEKKEA